MRILISSLLLIGALAACGGGGGGVTPTPLQTAPPTTPPVHPQSYTIAITYKGGLEPNGITVQEIVRHGMAASPAPSPIPVMLVAPDSTAPPAQYGPGVTGALVTANVEPSPSPPIASPPAWSSSSTAVAVASPQPSSSPALSTLVSVPTITTTGNCTISVNIGSPVNGTQSIPCYVYPRLTLWCPHGAPSTQLDPAEVVQGVAFDTNGNAIAQSDPSTSDVWIDGPQCYGAFQNTAEAGMTLHFAHGGTVVTGGWSSTPFYTVAATAYANTTSAVTIDASAQGDIFITQDAFGHAVKFEPNAYAFDSPYAQGNLSGAFQVSGHSIDGF